MADNDTTHNTTNGTTAGSSADNTQKDPDNWTTGEERATGAQLSYIQTMAEEAGQEVPQDLSKAEASKLIEELQAKTGRGQGS